MLILGIESSCDETAAAVVENGGRILSNIIASQILTHEKYGGVVPELASREHLRRIAPVVEEACAQAGASPREVDGIAVTEGPGLIGSLLVGVVFAKAMAMALGKPLIGVNHLEGHIHAVLLQNRMDRQQDAQCTEASFPALALVVSGGHTSLVSCMKNPAAFTANDSPFIYTRLGQTRDDAAGEAFDKVAKLLALGYPGGPIIDKLARYGNAQAVDFSRIKMRGHALDFSFSGVKTAVYYRLRGTELEAEATRRRAWRKTVTCPTLDELRAQCSQETLDLVASFQNAVVRDLVERTLLAAEQTALDSILVSGGVACNSLLRERFARAGREKGYKVFFPSPLLSTDNAAMIAAAGFYKMVQGNRSNVTLTARATYPLGAASSSVDTSVGCLP